MGDAIKDEIPSSRSSTQPVTPFKNFHLEVFESDDEDDDNGTTPAASLESVMFTVDTEETNALPNQVEWKTDVIKKPDSGRRKRKFQGGGIKGCRRKMTKRSKMHEEIFNQIIEKELDTIDSKASDSKLTVANVKHILKTVITNEHVVAMVRQQANEDADKSTGTEESYSYGLPGLKLTRSKTKELLATKPEMAWPLTPAKRVPEPTECQALIDQDLPEDSSDEEYQPNEDEIEDDRDETASEWDMSSQPATPGAASTPRPPSNLDCSTQTSWTEDGAFRVPPENIGQRTRSKLSLSDTALETIEKAFVPPDITTDMYDLVCEDDDWRDFLNKFTEPMNNCREPSSRRLLSYPVSTSWVPPTHRECSSGACPKPNVNGTLDDVDDDEADPEYNLLADEEKEDVDSEELRMDRGVKVSKKELNQLMTELFDMYDDNVPGTSRSFASFTVPEVPAYVEAEAEPEPDAEAEAEAEPEPEPEPEPELEPEVSPEEVEAKETAHLQVWDENAIAGTAILPTLTNEQVELLRQHMRKHVQLTAQHFVQTYGHPILSHHAAQCKGQLGTLKCLAEGTSNSIFNAENLDPALQLIEDWETLMDTNEEEAVSYREHMIAEINTARTNRKAKRKYICEFAIQTLEILSDSKAIIYPLLLPEIPFRCDGFYRTAVFPSEVHLLSIGLEQFLPYVKRLRSRFGSKYVLSDAVALTHQHLLPGHDRDFLLGLIKKRKCAKPGPIKYFFEHRVAPGTDHFVISFCKTQLKTLKEQPPELLPTAWREHVFPELDLKEWSS